MGSPPGGSTFTTSAPRPTRSEVAYGPGRQMLRSNTDTSESSGGDEGATGDILPPRTRRVACPRAGILLVHRSDPTVGPPALQRVAPPRPHARAVLARRCPLRPALGVHTRLPGGSSGRQPSARALPLHDPL